MSSVDPTRQAAGMSAFMAYWKSTMEQGRKDFRDLSTALKAGDVTAAQAAFADLQKILPNPASNASRPDADGDGDGGKNGATPATPATPAKDPAKDPRATVRADVDALGTALANGDLTAAQEAFTKLTTDMKALRGGHHHGHHQHHGGVKGGKGVTATPTAPDPVSLPATPAATSVTAKSGGDGSVTFFGIDLKA